MIHGNLCQRLVFFWVAVVLVSSRWSAPHLSPQYGILWDRFRRYETSQRSDIAEEFSHDGIVECLTFVLKSCSLVSRGDEEEGEGGEKPAFDEENEAEQGY